MAKILVLQQEHTIGTYNPATNSFENIRRSLTYSSDPGHLSEGEELIKSRRVRTSYTVDDVTMDTVLNQFFEKEE